MKIDRLESLYLGRNYLVRVHTDTGLTGLGQTACWGYPEAVERVVDAFGRYLVGQDPLRIEHHWQHLYRMSPFRGNAVAGALSAIDIALWDIKGKRFEVPVWELLGGRCRDRIRLCLMAGGPTPEAMAETARSAAAEGFTALKFDPILSLHPDSGLDRIVGNAVALTGAAREAGGPDLDLVVEVHRKLTPLTALAVAEALAQFNLYFLEDPIQIDSIQSQAEIARRTSVPIANGERLTTVWEFRELLEAGGPQYVRPDVALAGGLSHCRKIAAIAESYHCAVVTHNFLGPLTTAASLHLDASIPNFVTQEYTKGDEAPQNAVYRCAHRREGGFIPVPEAPGLGVEIDEEAAAEAFSPMNTGTTPISEDGSVAYAV